jgi:uncharacterized membrane protein
MHKLANIRIIAAAAGLGALMVIVGTYMHPMNADPNEPLAAFTEYAASRHWVFSHFLQLFGVILCVGTLLGLEQLLAPPAHTVACLGKAAAVASLAATATLQAVDGVALKAMADLWAAAPKGEQETLFSAVLAVRQIEIGLASITALLFGLTALLYGIALWIDTRFPKWLSLLALPAGLATLVSGIVIANDGFSSAAMAINMPATSLLMFWITGLGGCMWRLAGSPKRATP